MNFREPRDEYSEQGDQCPQNSINSQNDISFVLAVKNTGFGVFMCTLTLLGNRLGGGIVGLPHAIRIIGYLTAECIMVVYALMGMFSIWMLLRTREITGRASYPDLGIHLYGNWSIYFVNALIALAQCGYPIIFFIVFGDIAGALIKKIDSSVNSFWSSRIFTHPILAILMLYLIIQKEIHALKYAGFVLLSMILCFILLLFIHLLTSSPDPDPKEDLIESQANIQFFAAVPTIITSYSFQPSLFTAFGSLRAKTTGNGLKAGWSAIWTAFVVYAITPLLAFGLYGANVKGNLLKNISAENDPLPIILQIMFLVIAVVHIPIIFFIGKEAVLIMFDEATRSSYTKQIAPVQEENEANPEEIKESSANIRKNNKKYENRENNSEQDEEENKYDEIKELRQPPTKNEEVQENIPKIANPKEYLNMKPLYYYIVTIIAFIVILVLSIVVGNVSVVFGIIGSTASCWTNIAGPSSFYVLSIHKHKVPLPTWYLKLSYGIAWVFMVIGFGGMIGLSTCVILNAVS